MTTQKFCTQNPGLAPACGWPPMGTLGKAVYDLILVAGKVCVERLKLVNCKKIKLNVLVILKHTVQRNA